jgi:hypothetical protein
MRQRCRTNGQPPGWTRASLEVSQARENGGIPADAAIVGNYVTGGDADAGVYARDLLHLAEDSDVIVLGKVIAKSRARLLLPRAIMTDYTVEIVEWFHGPLVNGQQVVVTMPGGFVRFANGTTAEWREGRNRFFAINDEFVLYLGQISLNNSTFYVPNLGTQGVFGFGADGKVMPHAPTVYPLYKAHANMERVSFLNAVRATAVH